MACRSPWLPWAIDAWWCRLAMTSMRRPGTLAIGAMSTWVASTSARQLSQLSSSCDIVVLRYQKKRWGFGAKNGTDILGTKLGWRV